MEQIKFRQAILNKDGSFREWSYWGFVREGVFVGVELGASTHVQALENSWQHIGYKDKNGNDIYLGDFVKTDINDEIAEVIFDCECDSICCAYGEDFYVNCLWDRFEIVGNRYETPGLIK